jgi:hypothetical protein
MTDGSVTDDTPEAVRRFKVELLIAHPALDPEQISAALGLVAHFKHRAGDPRRAPSGTALPGNYRDTRWRHSRRCEVVGQHFARHLAEFVGELAPHRQFFEKVIASGGSCELIIQFLGDGYLGDTITRDTLAKLAELGVDFGIECFVVPQAP